MKKLLHVRLFHQFINMNKKIGKLVITMFGIGSIKYFPGTFASAITATIYLFFYMCPRSTLTLKRTFRKIRFFQQK